MKRKKRISLLLTAVLVIGMLVAGCAPTSSLGSLKSFSATTLDGGSFTQEDIQANDVTVINFWSLRCSPCIAEMPDHVQVVTVCLDGAGNEASVQRILSQANYEGVTLVSGDGDFQTLCGNLQYTPTTIFVDAKGNLVGNAIIGGQENLSEALLAAVNATLKAAGKAEIQLEK